MTAANSHQASSGHSAGTTIRPWEGEVFLGDGLVETYIGRGIWQTVKGRYVSFPNTL